MSLAEEIHAACPRCEGKRFYYRREPLPAPGVVSEGWYACELPYHHWATAVTELASAVKIGADELRNWGWGDFHYGDTEQDKRVVKAVQALEETLERWEFSLADG